MKTISHIRQLISESLVYGLSGIFSRLLFFILVPVYTHVFVPEEYGVIALIANTTNLVSMFVNLGLESAAARWFYDTESIEDRKVTIASWVWCHLGVALLFTVIILLFSDVLAIHVVSSAAAAAYFRLSALALFLSVLGTTVTNWLRLQRRPYATVCYSLATSALTVLLTSIFLLYLKTGLVGVYLSELITAAFSTFVAVFVMKEWLKPSLFSFERLRNMLRYSLPVVPAGIAYWAVNLSGVYFIKLFHSVSNVGLYQVGSSIAAAVLLLTGSFQQAWGPFAFSIHKDEGAKQVYADVLIIYSLITSLACVVLTLFAPEILKIVTTTAYTGSSNVVGIIAFNHVVIGLGYIAVIGPSIAKTTKPYGVAVILSALATLPLNITLVPILGNVGAAIASLVSQSIVPIYVFYCSQKLYPIPYRFKATIITIFMAIGTSQLGSSLIRGTTVVDMLYKVLIICSFVMILFLLRVISLDSIKGFAGETILLK